MSCRKLLDCVIVAFVGLDGLAFLNLRLAVSFLAKITNSILFKKLLEKQVFDHNATLSQSDVPVIRLNTISISGSRIGGRMRGVVSEALSSVSLGVIDAGGCIESDGTGLALHSDGIIVDGAFYYP